MSGDHETLTNKRGPSEVRLDNRYIQARILLLKSGIFFNKIKFI